MSKSGEHHNGIFVPLSEQKCVACEGNIPPLSAAGITALKSALDEGWAVVDGHHLSRRYGFRNFADALHFTNKVGAVSEDEGHHPDITIGWGKAEITLYTHSVNGLTMNDFIMAAKISKLAEI